MVKFGNLDQLADPPLPIRKAIATKFLDDQVADYFEKLLKSA